MGDDVRTTDTTEVDDDLRDAKDDAAQAADRAGDKVGDAADRAKNATADAGHKISNAVEDMIPGDSDGDGH